MKKTKGIVMRTSTNVSVIFTEKGDYIEIPTPKEPPLVGQTIELPVKLQRLPLFHNSWVKYSTAAVLLLVFSITSFYLLFLPNMAVASVALDINKGVEFSINKDGRVINVRDVYGGSSLVEGLSIQGLDVYQAVNLIVEKAKNQGTLNDTNNLVLASVVPMNQWGNQLIDVGKLRNAIRDDMIRRNQSGSVFVGQTNQKIQQEAQQQGMTVNSYLIYVRCQEKGITVQPDTFRNDVQKALLNANVSISSLFPEDSLEVTAQNGKGNSSDTKKESKVQNGPQPKPPSDMGSPSGSTPGMNSSAPSHSPVKQPMQGISPDMNKSSSNLVSPGSMPKSSSPQQPMAPSNGGMGH
ncbi:MAG: anti-sigma factor domain-containing protein [Desulfosporosinus sp.]|nr:anti-sigma factor domain-containing protein [Desulfosporosinus sp.]